MFHIQQKALLVTALTQMLLLLAIENHFATLEPIKWNQQLTSWSWLMKQISIEPYIYTLASVTGASLITYIVYLHSEAFVLYC